MLVLIQMFTKRADQGIVEGISTQKLMDLLEVPQRKRSAGTYRHLAKVMAELAWSPVRVRDFNGRGFREQVRGYVRTAMPFH
jgi:hypothetical protein